MATVNEKNSSKIWDTTRTISIGTDGELSWDTTNVRAQAFIPAKEEYYLTSSKGRQKGHGPREFIAWDGEGPRDTGYSLIGSSKGDYLQGPSLSSESCLQFLLDSAELYPRATNVGFGFNYDVSNMLKDLPKSKLRVLRAHNHVRWHGYRIEHVPKKWFSVSKDGAHIKIFDVQSFFNTSLVGALESWDIGPFASASLTSTDVLSQSPVPEIPSVASMDALSEAEIVRLFKRLRSEFLWKDIAAIKRYMDLELKYTVQLMDALRESFRKVGYDIHAWYGPGALARAAFRKHKIAACMDTCTESVRKAAKYAYFGGRFEQIIVGHVQGPVYLADINSAYPYACTFLPNLAQGHWERARDFVPDTFSVWHVSYEGPKDANMVHPLPFRDSHGSVSFPNRVSGWYWEPEIHALLDSPLAKYLTVHGGHVFKENNSSDRPFAFLEGYYLKRNALKRAGDSAEYTLKLVINSIYGQLAQRVGWDERTGQAPKSFQLEWAGYITSHCRARVWTAAFSAGESLISIDTDGVAATRPWPMENSNRLGDWEIKSYEDGVFWASGIYSLRNADGWATPKSRGMDKDLRGAFKNIDAELLLEHCRTGEPLRMSKKLFYSYPIALQSREFSSVLNTWRDYPIEFEIGGGKGSKRYHVVIMRVPCDQREKSPCGTMEAVSGDGFVLPNLKRRHIHRLAIPMFKYGVPHLTKPPMSQPHKLPWEEQTPQELILREYKYYDSNDADFRSEWIIL
jgi:DNA polymerase type B, organellar and viral